MTSFLPSRTPSVSSSEDSDDDQNYDDWVSASGDPQAKSLFEERELANITEALKYDRETHGFDLDAFSKQLGMPDLRVVGP
jgi:protein arginine N-methyltransferase 3